MAKIRHITIKDLQKAGIPVIPGNEYIPKKWLPKRPISLQEVHKRLSKIKGSLAEDIAQMREEA